jgi:hypothetical protein
MWDFRNRNRIPIHHLLKPRLNKRLSKYRAMAYRYRREHRSLQQNLPYCSQHHSLRQNLRDQTTNCLFATRATTPHVPLLLCSVQSMPMSSSAAFAKSSTHCARHKCLPNEKSLLIVLVVPKVLAKSKPVANGTQQTVKQSYRCLPDGGSQPADAELLQGSTNG